MKNERLYAITVYLLNHGRTSAQTLAGRFEVSVRTIQRDIDALCCAGIPVTAYPGANGGYEIESGFRLQGQAVTEKDYSHILTALRGLVSATEDHRIGHTLEKLKALKIPEEQQLVLDLSVLREGETEKLQKLRDAVQKKQAVQFVYTNNDGKTHVHIAEPTAVVYRWYAWYLLAWSCAHREYRLFKLARMEAPQITEQAFSAEHITPKEILKQMDRKDNCTYRTVEILCKPEAKIPVLEYLKGRVLEEYPDGSMRCACTVVENERFWFGALLSLGDAVEVLAPESIRQKVVQTAEKILCKYQP